MVDCFESQIKTLLLHCFWRDSLRDAHLLGLGTVFRRSRCWIDCDDTGVGGHGLGDSKERTLKSFRPAKPATFAWNYSKTLIQTACFWFVFLYLIPWLCLQIESAIGLATFSPQRVVSTIIFAFGAALGLGSSVVMAKLGEGTPLPPDCPRKLVIRGPYAYVRNPMAIGGILQGVAVGIWLGSWLTIGYALLGVPVWHWIARPPEERDMRERFGEQFENYERNVRLWIPRLTAYRPK